MTLGHLVGSTRITDTNKYLSIGADGAPVATRYKNQTLQNSLNSLVNSVSASLTEENSRTNIRELKLNLTELRSCFIVRKEQIGWKICKVWQNFLNLFYCGERSNPVEQKEREIFRLIDNAQRSLSEQEARIGLAVSLVPLPQPAQNDVVITTFEELDKYILEESQGKFPLTRHTIISIPNQKINFNDMNFYRLLMFIFSGINITINNPIYVKPSKLSVDETKLLKRTFKLEDFDLSSVHSFYITGGNIKSIKFNDNLTKDQLIEYIADPILSEVKDFDLSKTQFAWYEDVLYFLKTVFLNNEAKCKLLIDIILDQNRVNLYDRAINKERGFDDEIEQNPPGKLISLYRFIKKWPQLQNNPQIVDFNDWILGKIKTYSHHTLNEYIGYLQLYKLNEIIDFLDKSFAKAEAKREKIEAQRDVEAIARAPDVDQLYDDD